MSTTAKSSTMARIVTPNVPKIREPAADNEMSIILSTAVIIIAILCLTTTISLDQLKLGNFKLIAKPKDDMNSKLVNKKKIWMIKSNPLKPKALQQATLAAIKPGRNNKIFSNPLAMLSSFIETGKLWMIQTFFLSNEKLHDVVVVKVRHTRKIIKYIKELVIVKLSESITTGENLGNKPIAKPTAITNNAIGEISVLTT